MIRATRLGPSRLHAIAVFNYCPVTPVPVPPTLAALPPVPLLPGLPPPWYSLSLRVFSGPPVPRLEGLSTLCGEVATLSS